MGWISLEAKRLDNIVGGHLYLVYTDDSGVEWVIRGGPQFDAFDAWGNIETIAGDRLLADSPDGRSAGETPADRGSIILDLGGRSAGDVWSILSQQASNIAEAELEYTVDYNLVPFYDISQNSNSVIASVLQVVGISLPEDLPLSFIIYPGATNFLAFDYDLVGTPRADHLQGYIGNDTLAGGLGNDTLIGGLGRDTLDGGGGRADWASYADRTVSVRVTLNGSQDAIVTVGGVAEDTIRNIESLAGGSAADRLIGDSQSNFLRGGRGNDFLDGGGGFDFADYQGAASSVTVDLLTGTSSGNHGRDTLRNFEGIRGSASGDYLYGNDTGINYLRGGRGADWLDGRGGFDYADYWGASGSVTVNLTTNTASGADGTDTLRNIEGIRGSSYGDFLTGNSGGNWLNGGLGGDRLDGRGGLDLAVYFDAAQAVTASLANPGINLGEASGDTYVSIEGLVGSAFGDSLTGDSNNNHFRGLNGVDFIDGGSGYDFVSYYSDVDSGGNRGVVVDLGLQRATDGFGFTDWLSSIEAAVGTRFEDYFIGSSRDDQFFGLQGADSFAGGSGNDAVDYSLDGENGATSGVRVNLLLGQATDGFGFTDTLSSIEYVTGTGFADVFIGDDRNNTFRGLAGADEIDGGLGRDFVSYEWDQFYGGYQGINLNLALGQCADGFGTIDRLTGIENVAGTIFDDTMVGNSASNRLYASDGNDTLSGRGGNDYLHGGFGRDTFVFDTALGSNNVDMIAAFDPTYDTISLRLSIFGAVGPRGTLATDAFYMGAAAHDSTDRIIFNSSTGQLSYDPDGTGAGSAISFAMLSPSVGLTASDFIIV